MERNQDKDVFEPVQSPPRGNLRVRASRTTVVLNLDKVNDDEIHSNSMAETEVTDVVKEGFAGEKDFPLSSVLVPWVGVQWWKTFLIHVIPLPMLLLYPDMPELRACFIWFDGSKLPWRKRQFFFVRAFMQPLTVFIASCVMLWATCTSYFAACGDGLQNEAICGSDEQTCLYCVPGSLMCTGGLKSWGDILRGSPAVPVVAFFLYRIMIANKFACLSRTEYASYMLETDTAIMFENMLTFHLANGYYRDNDYSKERVKKLREFEITGAILRSGVDLSASRKFVINKPTSGTGDEALNFRRWQALLLGKRHLGEFEGLELHPLLEKVFEPATIDGVECYELDMYLVMGSILKWRDAVQISPLLTSMAKYYPILVTSIPFLSVFRFESFMRHYFGLQDIYTCTSDLAYEQTDNSIGKDLFALFVMVLWAYISYEPLAALFNILLMSSRDYWQRHVGGLLLQEMIRTSDLDTDRILSKMGVTQVQKQPVADFVSISSDTLAMSTESKRNPEIARMPRFMDGGIGSRGNILLWANMRCALLYYGDRFETRMKLFLTATLWVVIFASVYLLLTFVQSRAEYLYISENFDDPEALSGSKMVFFLGFSLDTFSPVSVEILALAIGYFSFTFFNIVVADAANKGYSNHYAVLNNRMNDLQRYRSRILVEQSYDEEKKRAKLIELSNISKAFEVVYAYVTDHDKIRVCEVFGLKADSSVLTFFITILGSAVSVFFAIGLSLNEAQQTIPFHTSNNC